MPSNTLAIVFQDLATGVEYAFTLLPSGEFGELVQQRESVHRGWEPMESLAAVPESVRSRVERTAAALDPHSRLFTPAETSVAC